MSVPNRTYIIKIFHPMFHKQERVVHHLAHHPYINSVLFSYIFNRLLLPFLFVSRIHYSPISKVKVYSTISPVTSGISILLTSNPPSSFLIKHDLAVRDFTYIVKLALFIVASLQSNRR